MSLLVALLVPAAVAACDAPVSTRLFAATVNAGTKAFVRLDNAGVRRAHARATRQIPCIDDWLKPSDVAAWHLLDALTAYLDSRVEGTDPQAAQARMEAAFRSMQATLPIDDLPSDIALPGHPLYQAFEQAGPVSGVELTLPLPDGMIAHIGGREAAGRPPGRPILLQVGYKGKRVLWTGELRPEQPAPDWNDVIAFPPMPVLPVEPEPPSKPLLLASATTGLCALGLYAGALASAQQYADLGNPRAQTRAELARLRTRANILSWSAIGFAGASAALGVSAFVSTDTVGVGWGTRW